MCLILTSVTACTCGRPVDTGRMTYSIPGLFLILKADGRYTEKDAENAV